MVATFYKVVWESLGAEDEGGWQKGRMGGRGRLRPMLSLQRLAPEASRWGFLNLGRDH